MSDPDQPFGADEPFDLEREHLDARPAPFDIDWGGDGRDLTRPVRAHVLAALRPSTGPYQPPLDALLTLGEIDDEEELERRRVELGIGQEHVPELVRMLRDRALNTADSDTPEVWAPIHALHLLATLDRSAAVSDLIPLFDLDFDRVGDELIGMLGATGTPAFAPLRDYISDQTRWVWGRARATDALKEIVERHPELREEAVTSLSAILAGAETDQEVAVTAAMSALVDLKAVEALPLIRHAFESEKIDESMHGAWGDVLHEIGVEPDPDDPLVEESRRRFEARHAQMFPADLRENLAAFQARHRAERAQATERATAQRRKQDKARKEKNKRKAASASRKANRKKRK
jgi:hypothetical protein